MERHAFHLLRDLEHTWWYRGRAHAILSALKRRSLTSVRHMLDFGAGYGGMRHDLSTVAKDVYAFEPDDEARESASRRGYADIFLAEDQALSQAYDLIGLFDVVEHIESDVDFLKNMRKALADGGHLVITVPAFQFLWSVHDVNHHHFRRYTKSSLRAVLDTAGYDTTYMSYWNTTLFIPAALVRFFGNSGESSFSTPWILDRIFLAIVRSESSVMRFGSLPFGTGLVAIARKR